MKQLFHLKWWWESFQRIILNCFFPFLFAPLRNAVTNVSWFGSACSDVCFFSLLKRTKTTNCYKKGPSYPLSDLDFCSCWAEEAGIVFLSLKEISPSSCCLCESCCACLGFVSVMSETEFGTHTVLFTPIVVILVNKSWSFCIPELPSVIMIQSGRCNFQFSRRRAL